METNLSDLGRQLDQLREPVSGRPELAPLAAVLDAAIEAMGEAEVTPASTAAASAASACATTTSGFCRRRASSHGDCGHANGSKKINDNHGCRRQSAHELAAYAA